jgi:hypothetical protein
LRAMVLNVLVVLRAAARHQRRPPPSRCHTHTHTNTHTWRQGSHAHSLRVARALTHAHSVTPCHSADLLFEGKVVGEATWSGIVVKVGVCGGLLLLLPLLFSCLCLCLCCTKITDARAQRAGVAAGGFPAPAARCRRRAAGAAPVPSVHRHPCPALPCMRAAANTCVPRAPETPNTPCVSRRAAPRARLWRPLQPAARQLRSRAVSAHSTARTAEAPACVLEQLQAGRQAESGREAVHIARQNQCGHAHRCANTRPLRPLPMPADACVSARRPPTHATCDFARRVAPPAAVTMTLRRVTRVMLAAGPAAASSQRRCV